MEGVEDAIDDVPVIDGIAGRVFGVGVGRAPFQRGGAISSSEQVVHSDIHGHWAESGQFAEKLLTVFRVRVIGLVVSEIVPGRRERTRSLSDIDSNVDSLRRLRGGGKLEQQEQG